MTTQYESASESRFASAVLPWLVAAVFFCVYLITLNHWVSPGSLPYVARATGQNWLPELSGPSLMYGNQAPYGPNGPLLYVVTLPFRLLPASMVPLAMNLFSAFCAAMTLALLVRTVALLPHDRTHEQREREYYGITLSSLGKGWIPPLVAAALCGFQLTFWENATAMSGAMLDLLVFAYVIRCLLEYRVDERDSWMFRAALAYGALMTDYWFAVGLLPALVIAVLWIKKVSFFNLRFLGYMALWGAIGMLFYLVLPIVSTVADSMTGLTFWQAFKLNVGMQKNDVFTFVQRIPGNYLLLLSLTSFLPLLLISIRWTSRFGDPSPLGTALTTGVFHLAHGAFLGACLWVSFDPKFSPAQLGLGLPILYYLSALSAGYFVGYFLLVFVPIQRRMQQPAFWMVLLNRISGTLIWLVLVLVPAGLIFKNLPAIRLTNGPALRQYTSLMAQNLPERGTLLSDDVSKLYLLHSYLSAEDKSGGFIYLDTQTLPFPDYQRYLERRYKNAWPMPPGMRPDLMVPEAVLVEQALQIGQKMPLYYVHPSFGYYFEQFYPVPHGIVYEMRAYPTNTFFPPPVSESDLAGNESFWAEVTRSTPLLVPHITEPPSGKSASLRQLLMEKLRIPFTANQTASLLGIAYSHNLNVWGITLQEAGRLSAAGVRFETALELNPYNLAARANLQLNKDLRAGNPVEVRDVKSFEEEFGRFRNWQQVLRNSGPFDDPTHRFAQARIFAEGGLLKQSIQNFDRITELAPDYVPAQFALARLNVALGKPEIALGLIEKIRSKPDAFEGTGIRRLDVVQAESVALMTAQRHEEAERVMREAVERNPKDEEMLSTVFQISSMFGRYTNALMVVERQLELRPDDPIALVNKGYLNLQIGAYEQAIPPLTRALSIETNNYTALLDRAIAYLRMDKYSESKADYEELRKVFPNEFRVYYGLGEIAWRQQDTNAAIRNYELFVANSTQATDEVKAIKERLRQLKGEPPEAVQGSSEEKVPAP